MKRTVQYPFVLLLLVLPCLAQTTPQPTSVTAAENSADAVNVLFTVRDSRGELLSDLPEKSFDVREDGRPQTIRSFSAKSNRPLTLGLLLETSGYMQDALLAEKDIATKFLSLVTPHDLAFLMSFDLSVDLLQDLTSDHRLLSRALDLAKINTGGRITGAPGRAGAHAVLHDAVYLAADEVLSKQAGRKVLVVFASGTDYGSKMKLKAAIEAAQRADAICYVVLFFRSSRIADIKELAEQTGGRAFGVTNAKELTAAVASVSAELRSLYNLTYISDNHASAAGFRRIEITAREGYKVQARKGYYPRQ